MLTKVILEGPMGVAFGREWNLAARSVREALNLIEANKPNLRRWIRANLDLYSHYRVTLTPRRGKAEDIDGTELIRSGDLEEIRFAPIVQGTGAVGKMIAGGLLIIAGAVLDYFSFGTAGNTLIAMGASMLIGGIIQALTPTNQNQRKDDASYYFDGPTNTVTQGMPVQLIYGPSVLVGSHPISISIVTNDVPVGSV